MISVTAGDGADGDGDGGIGKVAVFLGVDVELDELTGGGGGHAVEREADDAADLAQALEFLLGLDGHGGATSVAEIGYSLLGGSGLRWAQERRS